MRSIMETLDGEILENGTLTATGEKALNFYKTWKDAMAGWKLDNLKSIA